MLELLDSPLSYGGSQVILILAIRLFSRAFLTVYNLALRDPVKLYILSATKTVSDQILLNGMKRYLHLLALFDFTSILTRRL